ncbi:MAG: hypothetical protein ACREJD_03740 [Phycisphaerales bacterium]
MSATRRFPFSRNAISESAQALQERLRSALPDTRRRPPAASAEQAESRAPDFSQTFSELVSRTVRIATIDLDRDPWWLYFRRRR